MTICCMNLHNQLSSKMILISYILYLKHPPPRKRKIFCSDLSTLQTISLTADMVASSQHLFQAALSPFSRSTYYRGSDLFLERKPSYSSLPMSQVNLCNFISYLFSENYSHPQYHPMYQE